jgi:hypothetical protein
MAALPINNQILDRYFQSDDDDSDWIAVRMNKETMTASQKIMMKYGQRFRDVEVHDFTERTGPVF